MEKDVIEKRVWNTKQLITIVVLAISITFSATMIWGRFLFVEKEVNTVDNRYRKITDRMIIRIENLETTVNNKHK